jgi:hypothetical protein
MSVTLQDGLIALAVAAIGLMTALVEKSRRENTRDHSMVRERLDDLKGDIRHLDDKVDEGFRMVHGRIDDHLASHSDSAMTKRSRKVS